VNDWISLHRLSQKRIRCAGTELVKLQARHAATREDEKSGEPHLSAKAPVINAGVMMANMTDKT